jgi:hypothetical protein
MNVLVVVNDQPYGSERPYSALPHLIFVAAAVARMAGLAFPDPEAIGTTATEKEEVSGDGR